MKIVLAPNAFKEALPAAEAARAMARGFRRALPDAELLELPVADGGDGTAEIFRRALGGRARRCRVTGPLGRPAEAELIRLGGQETPTDVVEVAQSSGLKLVPPSKRNPLRTSSRGLGEMIEIARRRKTRRLIIGLGGSATVDGGTGMAAALGFKLLDERGRRIPDGGRGLEKLARIVAPPAWNPREPRGRDEFQITAVCDVSNRLLGPDGAAAVYGPQKGATPAMVRRLEAGLRNLARRFELDLGKKIRALPGSGAAGGLGAGLAAFLGAELRPGAELVLDVIGFREAIRDADWIVTGEGRLDSQTLKNKAPAVVARIAGEAGKPTIALAGQVDLASSRRSGSAPGSPFAACFSIAPGPLSLADARARTAELLERACFEVGRLLLTAGFSRTLHT